jgi:hypothetical protein
LGLTGRARGAVGLLGATQVGNGGRPFAGDNSNLATLGPTRPTARIHFTLNRRSRVTLDVLETGQGVASEQPAAGAQSAIGEQVVELGPGSHQLNWTPAPTLPARTYILRLTAQSGVNVARDHVVARILGVDAAFASRSARPTDALPLVVATDAKTLTVQMVRSGPELIPTYVNNVINGVPVGDPMTVDWTPNPNAPAPIPISIPGDWQSGVYAAQITADDGRVGFAPLVIRPLNPIARVAVMVPTTTWGAYNFFDANGDGWGDTWYARWKTNQADLTRPNPTRGVPYRYRSYDLAFYQWLARTGIAVDMYADEDLERFATPHDLRAAYDLIVFPGHTEYVTSRMYTMTEAFRDLGGNLLFMSANNFFRRVERPESTLTLINEWRSLGRPEAALCGVQYLASDRGQRRAPFTVVGAETTPWAFVGTGMQNGSQFGIYGIEIDARAKSSPSTVQVLCNIPNLFGPGRTAEMTYYEHWSGARVFSAGALDFGGQVLLWPQTRQLLENVWARLTER